ASRQHRALQTAQSVRSRPTANLAGALQTRTAPRSTDRAGEPRATHSRSVGAHAAHAITRRTRAVNFNTNAIALGHSHRSFAPRSRQSAPACAPPRAPLSPSQPPLSLSRRPLRHRHRPPSRHRSRRPAPHHRRTRPRDHRRPTLRQHELGLRPCWKIASPSRRAPTAMTAAVRCSPVARPLGNNGTVPEATRPPKKRLAVWQWVVICLVAAFALSAIAGGPIRLFFAFLEW